jgi:hypothetical protein
VSTLNPSQPPNRDNFESNYNLPAQTDYLNKPAPDINLLSPQLSADSDIRNFYDFSTTGLERQPTGKRTEASFPEDNTESGSTSQSPGSPPFICNICNRTQKNKKALAYVSWIRTVLAMSIIANFKPIYRKHLRQEHSASHRCDFPTCGAAFGTKDYLQRHKRRIHSAAHPPIFHQCPECPQTFKNRKDNLRRHLKDKHGQILTR